MNRKKLGNLFKKILTLTLLAMCSACMNKKADSAVTEISFWSFPNFSSEAGSGNGSFEQNLIAAFEKEYPSIKVHLTLIDFATGESKIEKAVSAGNAPDIVYDAPGRIIGWAEKGLLEPLDDVLAAEKPHITATLLQVSAGKDRRTYMYPMHEVPFSMAFNKEMLEDLDLIDLLPYKRGDRRWTVAEYETLLTALKEKLPAKTVPGVFYYKNTGGDQGSRAFLVNLYGNVSLLNIDYSKYIFNTPEAVKNMQWVVNALKNGLLFDGKDIAANEAIEMFALSKAAHSILYSPQLNKLYNGKRSYKGKDFTPIYMPFPNDGGTPSLEFLAGGACIFNNKDTEKIKAAKKFLHFAATDEIWAAKLVKATGGFPATSKIEIETEDPEILYNSVLQRFFGQYYNNVTGFSKVRRLWNILLNDAASGKSLRLSLDTFVQNADNTLNK